MPEEFKSKKWRTTMLGLVGMLISNSQGQEWYVGVSMVAAAALYVLAQGLADRGKEQAKVMVEAADDGLELAKAELEKLRQENAELKAGDDESDDG